MNDTFFRQSLNILSQAWYEAVDRSVEILPQAVVAILILLCGWLIASLMRFMLLKFLGFFAVDKLVGKTPLARVLRDVGIHRTASEILASLLFWLVILFTLIFASEALALTQVAQALTVVTRYVPKIIAAFLIVMFGMLLAKFLQTFVVQTIGHTQRQYEKLAGKIVHAIVLVFVLIAALDQLEVQLSLVTTNFMILLGVIVGILGIGLTVAARPLLENALACQQLQSIFKIGDELKIFDVHGTLMKFTVTNVVIKTENREIFVPAKLFLEQRSERRVI